MAIRLNPAVLPGALIITALAGAHLVTRMAAGARLGTRHLPLQSPAEIEEALAARRWRSVNTSLEVARYRLALAPRFRQLADTSPSIALTIEAPDSLRGLLDTLLRPALRRRWQDLGLGVTKVAVGVVVRVPPRARNANASTPPPADPGVFWILPDSSLRTACLAVVPIDPERWRKLGQRPVERRARWIGEALGPCELMARFGAPGPRVRRWLDHRGYDLAAAGEPEPGDQRTQMYQFLLVRGPLPYWLWPYLHQLRPPTLGCLSGVAEACRVAVSEGDDPTSWAGPRRVVSDPPQWDLSAIGLVGGEHFLHAVAAAAGAPAFQQFWTTDLPVDSALTIALGQPVGGWTARWERTFLPPPPASPAPAAADLGLSLLVIGVGVGAAMVVARRRAVR